MKTLRDTNNNNNSSTRANGSWYQATTVTDPDGQTPSHRPQHSTPRTNVSAAGNETNILLNSSKLVNHHASSPAPAMTNAFNPYAALLNGDLNQFTAAFQTYLTNLQKLNGGVNHPAEMINPLLYLPLVNANALLMQQLAAMPMNPSSFGSPSEPGGQPHVLQADSDAFVPKTRSMTKDEIAEHARSIYQRALQRNQLQQQSELMKHFYESLNCKGQDSANHSRDLKTIQAEVPGVPNASHITSLGAFDVVDTVMTSSVTPSSCLSVKEPSVEAALSSLSLLSVDDSKLIRHTSFTLDPGAPVFIPRQSGVKLDDDQETSSSSSDSDFNDFHYLDQFLDEFYPADAQQDNHLLLLKSSPSELSPGEERYPLNVLGQGDAIEKIKPTFVSSPSTTAEQRMEAPVSTKVDQQQCQYSIYELLNRYRNPRCHLVLPEWSRLSLILPDVCSMRAQTYKIKRYFAYRRRLCDDQMSLHRSHRRDNDLHKIAVEQRDLSNHSIQD